MVNGGRGFGQYLERDMGPKEGSDQRVRTFNTYTQCQITKVTF